VNSASVVPVQQPTTDTDTTTLRALILYRRQRFINHLLTYLLLVDFKIFEKLIYSISHFDIVSAAGQL